MLDPIALPEDGLDVGRDDGTNVSFDYRQGENAFRGTIHSVRIDLL